MKRKTKNASLLAVIDRQEQYIRSLKRVIEAKDERDQARDEAMERFTDARIKEINTAIRTAKKPQDYYDIMDRVFGAKKK